MDEAITRKKKVTLDYLHYGYDKRQHPTATYTLSPYEMVYTNEHYYLICVPDHDPHTRLYRIDRMADIRILDEPRSALQYLSFVEVAEPAWLRDEITESIAGNQYTNRKDG